MAWLMTGVWSLPEVDEQPNQPMSGVWSLPEVDEQPNQPMSRVWSLSEVDEQPNQPMSRVWSLPEVDEQPNQPMWFKFPKHQFGKTKVVNCSFSEPVVKEVVLVSLRWILGPYLYNVGFQSQFCLITASEAISEYPILKIYWGHIPLVWCACAH